MVRLQSPHSEHQHARRHGVRCPPEPNRTTSRPARILKVRLATRMETSTTRATVMKAAQLRISQTRCSAHELPCDSIYHPTLVGPDFFHKTGGVL
jgi:hypothetical protein